MKSATLNCVVWNFNTLHVQVFNCEGGRLIPKKKKNCMLFIFSFQGQDRAYDKVSSSNFTRTISNPENVLKRKRQQKQDQLEKFKHRPESGKQICRFFLGKKIREKQRDFVSCLDGQECLKPLSPCGILFERSSLASCTIVLFTGFISAVKEY